ncbi:MAG TPA: hypothetical protein VE397_04725 [Stellaceae bacterium]|jgi:hypothetical protein|nr:hypothetical protein [Stellaceae bacterium]
MTKAPLDLVCPGRDAFASMTAGQVDAPIDVATRDPIPNLRRSGAHERCSRPQEQDGAKLRRAFVRKMSLKSVKKFPSG